MASGPPGAPDREAFITPRRAPRRAPAWRGAGLNGLIYQALALAVVALTVGVLAHFTLANMEARGIQSGFGFLGDPAGFDIGEDLIGYQPSDPYWKAYLVGIVNTLRVALLGVVLATVLGVLLGIGRFSHNAIVRGLAYGYVELFRNVPVLLQLLMWYLLLTDWLPLPNEAIELGPLRLSKNGFSIPVPVWETGHTLAMAGAVLGLTAAWGWRRWARQRFDATGRLPSLIAVPIALVLVGAVAGWALGGAPSQWSVPQLDGFMLSGGASATPEFMAVLIGLSLYTAAFIAEVVRAGIASVAHGQIEAAGSLGLSKSLAMRLVVLPQALRVIIPPMTGQYLNLTKNSSLAVAIGYPDVVSIASTTLNQTGRAVECIALIMAVYLTTSLGTSALMNAYNRHAAIRER